MAYIKFCILAVETDLKEQSIIVQFNKQVDTDTVTPKNVYVTLNENNMSTTVPVDIIVDDSLQVLQIKFKETPIINQQYTLLIQDTVLDLEGNQLEYSLFRNVVFNSTVISDIELLSPSNYEVVKSVATSWEELGDSPVNRYRLQVSTDTAFHNIQVNSIVVGKTEVEFSTELTKGQYFWRVRAETKDEYGSWSEIRTFLLSTEPSEVGTITHDESDDIPDETAPIIEDLVSENENSLVLLQGPESGSTLQSFLFNFSEDIDISDMKVSIIRSDY